MEELSGEAVEEDTNVEEEVHDSLFSHRDRFASYGAGAFVRSVVSDGFILNLFSKPEKYQERNNNSFSKNQEFAMEELRKS